MCKRIYQVQRFDYQRDAFCELTLKQSMPLEIVMFAVGYELLQNRLVEQETRSEATDWETGGPWGDTGRGRSVGGTGHASQHVIQVLSGQTSRHLLDKLKLSYIPNNV